jgi:hypothetical protein
MTTIQDTELEAFAGRLVGAVVLITGEPTLKFWV